MSLVDKIRKARETGVEVNGKQYTIRRPTDEEAIGLRASSLLDVVKGFTIGWSLCEIDIVPGGSAVPVPFDAELFAEWVADQPEVWEPLGAAILQAYKDHADKREAASKN